MKQFSKHLLAAFSEGLASFRKIFTQVLWQQFVLLASLFFAVSFVFNKAISVPFYAGLGIGIVFFTLLQWFLLKTFKEKIEFFIMGVFSNYQDLIRVLFSKSFFVAFMILILALFPFALTLFVFGFSGVLGYLVSALLITFLLRIGGGIYWVSSEISKSITEGKAKQFPTDHRNPASILEFVGTCVGSYLGMIQDFLFSILLLLSMALYLQHHDMDVLIFSDFAVYGLLLSVVLITLLLAKVFFNQRIKSSSHNALLEFIYAFLILILSLMATFLVYCYFFAKDIYTTYSASFFLMGMSIVAIVVLLLIIHTFINPQSKALKQTAESAELTVTFPILKAADIGFQSSAVFYFLLLMFFSLFFFFFPIHLLWVMMLGIAIPLFAVLVTLIFSNFVFVFNKIYQLNHMRQWEFYMAKLLPLSRTVSIFANSLNVMISLIMAIALLIFIFHFLKFESNALRVVVLGFSIGLIIASFYLSVLMKGMLKTVFPLLHEITRQFREIPYLLEGKVWPDIKRIAGQQSIIVFKQLLVPGLLLLSVVMSIFLIDNFYAVTALFFGIFMLNLFHSYQWANLGDVIKSGLYFVEKGRYGGVDSIGYDHLIEARNFSNSFQVILSQAAQLLLKAAIVFFLMNLKI